MSRKGDANICVSCIPIYIQKFNFLKKETLKNVYTSLIKYEYVGNGYIKLECNDKLLHSLKWFLSMLKFNK